MRIFRPIALLAAIVCLTPVGSGLAPAGSKAWAAQRFSSTEKALEHGIGAYKGGYFEHAIPALEFAARKDDILALFYLARIYSNNIAAHTDHPRAYRLYQRIVATYGDIDQDRIHHARVVAKALTAVAGYVLNGLPEIGLKADPWRAAQFLHTAATVWNDPDAQYELAKLYLRGEGVTADPEVGRHWLIVLSKKGYAPAQAYFADMLWRGRDVKKDLNRALALITLAVQNAPPEDRVWIEDIYQNIFCGTSMGTHRQADGLVAVWSRSFGRPDAPSRQVLQPLMPQVTRACGDGQAIPMPRPIGAARDADLLPRGQPQIAAGTTRPVVPAGEPSGPGRSIDPLIAAPPRMAQDRPVPEGFVRGSTAMGLIDAGAKSLVPAPPPAPGR